MHVWMSSYSWGWELSSKPSLLPKPENGLIQRNTEIPKWCIGTSAGDLKSHRIKGYGGTLVRGTTTHSSAMAPKAVWNCFSSSSRPSEPWRNPDLAGLGHTPTMDQSQVQQRAASQEGEELQLLEEERFPWSFPPSSSVTKSHSLPKDQVVRRKSDRHKTAWFSRFHQLDLPVERKQSLSKSQLSFCLSRKIPIKDKANFNQIKYPITVITFFKNSHHEDDPF